MFGSRRWNRGVSRSARPVSPDIKVISKVVIPKKENWNKKPFDTFAKIGLYGLTGEQAHTIKTKYMSGDLQ